MEQHSWPGISVDYGHALVEEILVADRDICKDRHHSELPNAERNIPKGNYHYKNYYLILKIIVTQGHDSYPCVTINLILNDSFLSGNEGKLNLTLCPSPLLLCLSISMTKRCLYSLSFIHVTC